MRMSFDSLKLMAQTKGADFDKGDVCYFENSNQDRRKVLFQKSGLIFILYWMKLRGKFVPVNEKDGLLKHYVDFKE